MTFSVNFASYEFKICFTLCKIQYQTSLFHSFILDLCFVYRFIRSFLHVSKTTYFVNTNILKIVHFVFYLLLLLKITGLALSDIPQLCSDHQSLQLRECCPVAKDGSKCGETSQRGFCGNLSLSSTNALRINEVKLLFFVCAKLSS